MKEVAKSCVYNNHIRSRKSLPVFAGIIYDEFVIQNKKKSVGIVSSICQYFPDVVLRAEADKPTLMDENFDRATGPGRIRNLSADPGFGTMPEGYDSKTASFNQREPLRQPRTSPTFSENNISAAKPAVSEGRSCQLANRITVSAS